MTKIVDRVPHMQEGAKIQSVSWAQVIAKPEKSSKCTECSLKVPTKVTHSLRTNKDLKSHCILNPMTCWEAY